MRIDENKLNLARSRSNKTLNDLGIDARLMKRIRSGKNLQIRTVHRIAAALDIDPAEIVATEEVN